MTYVAVFPRDFLQILINNEFEMSFVNFLVVIIFDNFANEDADDNTNLSEVSGRGRV